MRRFSILGTEEAVTSELAPRRQVFYDEDIPLDGPISLKKITRQAVLDIERKVILRVLQANHWNRKKAARALSISYRALLYKIRDAGLPAARAHGRTDTGSDA
jgi:two-component system response regulator AtoC